MFTFKKVPRETGLRSVAYPSPITNIKVKSREVGQITPPNHLSGRESWKIQLQVVSDDSTGWRWIRFTKGFETEPEARVWLKENYGAIVERWEIYNL